MNTDWFEMRKEIQRKYADGVLIPLRISKHHQSGEHSHVGWKDEFIGVTTVAVRVDERSKGEKITWGTMLHDPGPYADISGHYKPADVYEGDNNEAIGSFLVLPQQWPGVKHREWHLNQDLVMALGLLREGDVWVCPEEGFTEVVRLDRDEKGNPASLVIKANFLKDYLAARGLALRITSFRNRDEIVEDASFMNWDTR